MKKAIFLICILFTTFVASAQFGNQTGRNGRFGSQQPNVQPNETQIEDMKRKQKERKKEFVLNFLSTLEADDFQKEITKITLEDYFVQTEKFLNIPFDNSTIRKDAFQSLRFNHFTELKTMLSKNDNEKLDKFLDGDFKEKEVVKKKKKKRKKKNKDN